MRMFGSKKMEIRGVWRKLHKDKLQDVKFSLKIIKVIISMRDQLSSSCSTRGRDSQEMLIGKHEEQRLTGRLERIRQNNITTDIIE